MHILYYIMFSIDFGEGNVRIAKWTERHDDVEESSSEILLDDLNKKSFRYIDELT